MAVTIYRNTKSIKCTAASDAITERFKYKRLVWTAFTGATDTLTLLRASGGEEIVSIQAGATNGTRELNLDGKWLDGVYIQAMTSGTVYFFYE